MNNTGRVARGVLGFKLESLLPGNNYLPPKLYCRGDPAATPCSCMPPH